MGGRFQWTKTGKGALLLLLHHTSTHKKPEWLSPFVLTPKITSFTSAVFII